MADTEALILSLCASCSAQKTKVPNAKAIRSLDSLSDLMESDILDSSSEVYKCVLGMVASNLFRPLVGSDSLTGVPFDPLEDDPLLLNNWAMLEMVYEVFLKMMESEHFNSGLAKEHFSDDFVISLVKLFDSEDPRERDMVKTSVHRVYARFLHLRKFIRKVIGNVLLVFLHDTQIHNGVLDILELLGRYFFLFG